MTMVNGGDGGDGDGDGHDDDYRSDEEDPGYDDAGDGDGDDNADGTTSPYVAFMVAMPMAIIALMDDGDDDGWNDDDYVN